MIAIPVKTNTPQSAVAPLFGKAKWFALVDDAGEIAYWRNELGSGRAVVDHFIAEKVDTILFQEMGGNPFMLLNRAGIACAHVGEGRTLLADAVTAYRGGTLDAVTLENMYDYVEKPRKHSKGGEHHDHDHDHGEGHAHGHCGTLH